MVNPDDRPLPQSLDAERSVLGAILLHEDVLLEVAALITPRDFFRDAHRRLFATMLALHAKQVAIDLTTMREALTRTGDLDEVGGPAYITSLVDGVPRATNVAHYATIIREKAALRTLMHAASTMFAEASTATHDATTVLEAAERTILGLADQQASQGFESMAAIAPRALALLEQRCATRQAVSGVPTGFLDLDHLTRGLQPGTLVVVGGRPGLGKSSFAGNVAQHAARVGRIVGFFSLEMPSEELFFRQLASTARIDSHRIQSGFVGEREWGRLAEALGTLGQAPLYLDETAAITLFAVKSRARRLKAERGLDLLIIDYLQLMTAGPEETRAQAIGAITAGLKAFAKELKIPILLLSQLNRESDKRGTRPRLSDLKESGSIEQDADLVLLLHRPEEMSDGGQESITEVLVAKHRNGPTGSVKLRWHDQQTRFSNYTDQVEPADHRLPVGDR